MNDRERQFLALYDRFRVQQQIRFYTDRRARFETGHTRIVIVTGILLILTAVAGVLGATNVAGAKGLWGVLAVAFPALSTALAGFDGLYNFERHAKLYGDAINALTFACASTPLPESPPAAAEEGTLVTYVHQVEGIFGKEQGQWGQMIREISPADSQSGT
jgi:hypothetical protein